MDIISMILSLLCGVALFLYGMQLMGDGLKTVAGNKLEAFLYKMTNTPIKGVLLGTGVTSVIQSSSATTVMVIGFVNSGMMKLHQAIGIIMGANIGTSITGWILCLSYIEGSSGVARLLSSATISAVVAIAGMLLKMLAKRSVHKNVGNIMLGFAILMVGMQMMSGAVAPLKESEAFTNALTMFSNPLLGILLGIGMTAILQSASASVGILQALSVTGALTFATAFPVILGIGVGAACPVMISSIGANKNGKRSALVYLLDDVFGMVIWGIGFYALNAVLHFPFLGMKVTPVIIAAVNSVFRIVTVCILFPFIKRIEQLVTYIIKDSPEDLEDDADFDLLEERLLISPPLALGQCTRAIDGMSRKVRKNVGRSLNLIHEFSQKKFEKVQSKEELIDKYESKIGEYLVKLSKKEMNSQETRQMTLDLRAIGDLERMGDYASNIARITNEINENQLQFSGQGQKELNVAIEAEREIVNTTIRSYQNHDLHVAMQIKPMAAAISNLCEDLKQRHIARVSRGECTLGQGNAFNELLNSFERIASHCVSLSGAIRRENQANPDYHVHSAKVGELNEETYKEIYDHYLEKYDVLSAEEHPVSLEAEETE
ncbi:MAG: Na/Pi cotransporter family protein [Lachnospiraceae bacterium]|nr:Na/Pi cotransporter family protein [Lachnospiraceae bacterium]